MIRRVLFALAAMCSCAAAQSGIESVPAAESSPAPAIVKKLPDKLPPAEALKRTTEEIVSTFFDKLKSDQVEGAYATLKTQPAMADRGPEEAGAMREQTQKALDTYGPVLGWELVNEEKLGNHLLRRTYLLLGEVLPLRWKFYFYKPADRWMLIDLRIDDTIPAWFDEKK